MIVIYICNMLLYMFCKQCTNFFVILYLINRFY